jgi:hypothetical protein
MPVELVPGLDLVSDVVVAVRHGRVLQVGLEPGAVKVDFGVAV